MSREIEVKVVGLDLDILEERLKSIGAGLISYEEQKNIILNTDSYFKEKNLDGYLRIREVNNKLLNRVDREITLKENMGRDGVRENIEIESEISDLDAMLEILSKLGYEVDKVGYKTRKSYLYDGIRFDLDTWDKETYPEPYMEIEVEGEEDLDRAIELLSIDKKNITTKSIVDLRRDLENQSY